MDWDHGHRIARDDTSGVRQPSPARLRLLSAGARRKSPHSSCAAVRCGERRARRAGRDGIVSLRGPKRGEQSTYRTTTTSSSSREIYSKASDACRRRRRRRRRRRCDGTVTGQARARVTMFLFVFSLGGAGTGSVREAAAEVPLPLQWPPRTTRERIGLSEWTDNCR